MKKTFLLCAFADEAASDLHGQVDALKQNQIKWLEIRGIDDENISIISLNKARQIRNTLDDNGIQVWSIGSPTGKISLDDDFDQHLDNFKHMVELANILGASHYRLFSFYGTHDKEKSKPFVLEKLNKIVNAAQGSGLTLCHENEKDIFGERAQDCLEIHKAIPEIRAVFDPANFIQVNQDIKAGWEMLAPYVEYLHIKDARLKDGAVVPAGKGDGEISYVLEKYYNQNGKILTLESHLADFVGLDNLENQSQSKIEFAYSSQRQAFDAAVSALRSLI